MKKFIFFFLIFLACSNSGDKEISDNNQITKLEDVKSGVVRIEVKSVKAEINDSLNISNFEYESSGSGFFINDNGFILTNNHVISGSVTIEVYTSYRDQPYNAQLVGLSECDDLAVLKIDLTDNKYFKFSDKEYELGNEIFAIGFPLGDEELTLLDGIISKAKANGSTTWASLDYAFEHTAEILPGSSGGPIINEDIEVIGIAYAGNINKQEFGIPILSVENKIDLLLSGEFNESLNINIEQFEGLGLYIYSVESKSPLYQIGINGGQLITEIQGASIRDEISLEMYCSSIYSRDSESAIKFTAIDFASNEEIEFEVSIDGTISNILSSKNINLSGQSNASTTTTTVPPTTSTTTTTIPRYVIYDVIINTFDECARRSPSEAETEYLLELGQKINTLDNYDLVDFILELKLLLKPETDSKKRANPSFKGC